MTKAKFKVWCEDNSDESEADTVESFEAQYAAEKWVEDRHADLDYPDEIDVKVKDPKGVITEWTVTVESRPHFSAVEKEKGESDAT